MRVYSVLYKKDFFIRVFPSVARVWVECLQDYILSGPTLYLDDPSLESKLELRSVVLLKRRLRVSPVVRIHRGKEIVFFMQIGKHEV